jgi:GNAT superfamily N-acetyltransferase
MPVAIRLAEIRDAIAMAAIRARDWETQEYWEARIRRYLNGEQSPREGLSDRAAFVAVEGETIVGFVAGHRTRRYGCAGELQGIDVIAERRRHRIAGLLLVAMAEWFAEQNALRVCVNVEPANAVARKLYEKYGARTFHEYWMVWEDIREISRRS